MKYLIIGGVAGGATAAARLRRIDENSEIILLEKGKYISYANCGLPYYIGGIISQRDRLLVQTPESFARRFRIDVRTEQEAKHIDPARRIVQICNKAGQKYEESYDRLLLSPGSIPVRPPLPGIDTKGIFTLRTVDDTDRIKAYIAHTHPKHAIIVGAGFIGLEMAENLHHAGIRVSIVEMASQVMSPLDYSMAAPVARHLAEKGVGLYLEEAVDSFRRTDAGIEVTLKSGKTLAADLVLLSIGVRPESSLAKACGLPCNARGGIQVDEHMRTADPDIYAVGDAVEVRDFVTGDPAMVPLAGPANREGRIAADNLFGRDSVYTGTQGSAILKIFDMAVATTGLSEKAARSKGIDCDKIFTYSANHASYYPGSTMLSIKVVFEKGSGRLLGAQIVGFDGVDKRCDVLATAIRFGATVQDLTRLELCYAPPFGSAKDPVNMVGFVGENLQNGTVRQFHWSDVADLPRDGSVQLVDVRTPAEYARGHIEGFRNLPLDGLRAHLSELDPGKPVYVHCHSGLRSYIACRLLTGAGFTCYNLAGGYRLWAAIQQAKTPVDHPCYFKN